jgi:hypothetical protein
MHPERTGDAIRDPANAKRGTDVTHGRYLANRLNRCGLVTDTRKSNQQATARVVNERFPGQFVVNHLVPRWLPERHACILRMNRGVPAFTGLYVRGTICKEPRIHRRVKLRIVKVMASSGASRRC